MTELPEDKGGLDSSGRFLQATSFLIEWVKHLITVASALMVLGAAILKDLVVGFEPPLGYGIAALFILSYGSMLVAVWKSLAFIRRAATAVLTTADSLGSGNDLRELQGLLKFAQRAFLAGLILFATLAATALIPRLLRKTDKVPNATPSLLSTGVDSHTATGSFRLKP